ncbi:MAG: c-type cytochrome [Syntrophobacter sp.]
MVAVLCALALGFSAFVAFAGNGQTVYSDLKCGICHKPQKKAAAVSLSDIAGVYQAKKKLLGLFNNPDPKPLIETERWGMMLPHFQDISALSSEDKSALAEYMLSFKQ